MMIDPEGSPARPNTVFSGMNGQNDDPWFSGSAQESPSSDSNRPSFDYSNYGRGAMSGAGEVNNALSSEEDYDNEPPLLEELGINFRSHLDQDTGSINTNKGKLSVKRNTFSSTSALRMLFRK